MSDKVKSCENLEPPSISTEMNLTKCGNLRGFFYWKFITCFRVNGEEQTDTIPYLPDLVSFIKKFYTDINNVMN